MDILGHVLCKDILINLW